MTHILIMLLIAPLAIADSVEGLPLWREGPQSVLVRWGVPLVAALLAGGFHCFAAHCARRIDATGQRRWVARLDLARAGLWMGLGAVFWVAVLVLGWLQAVRGWLGGDVILLDEAIAVTPVLLGMVWAWWAVEPVERRLREAAMLRRLDEGMPVASGPGRARFVLGHVRHELLIVLVPLTMLTAWSDAAPAVVRAMERWLNWRLSTENHELVVALARLGGAAAVLLLSPLLLPLMWSTRRLGEGPLRAMLASACARHRVKFRDILVWRTGGTLLNAAVVGAAGPARYVLLSDALLESLTGAQIEAVMAHEIGHARRAHVPWLLASVMVGAGLAWFPAVLGEDALLAWAARNWGDGELSQGVIEALRGGAASMIASMVAGIVVMGWVSRRFEWQADAFAVAHMNTGEVIQEEAARAMSGALHAVAVLNGIDPAKFTFRHGSITERQRRIAALVGARVDRLPIDRAVRVLKWSIVAGIAGMVGLAIFTGRY